MKCTCGIIWLTDTSFKRTLDIMYQNGARNLKLFFIIKEVVWPVVCNLLLCLAIPYVLFMGVLKSMGEFSLIKSIRYNIIIITAGKWMKQNDWLK